MSSIFGYITVNHAVLPKVGTSPKILLEVTILKLSNTDRLDIIQKKNRQLNEFIDLF